jgi:DNA-directed RNA polymerase sigma subunit (sigma70/sigma32)
MRSELGNWAKLAQHRVGAINLVSDGTPMLEVFVEDRPEPWQEYVRMEEELEAKRGMLGLSEREEETLFGLMAGISMQDMADEWDVTRQRVAQYKRNAFARIRELYPEGF